MKGKVEQLNVKRVQKYMAGLPEDENGNGIVTDKDLENLRDLFFGHNRGNRKTLRQMIEEQG